MVGATLSEALGIPSTWQLALTYALDLACANAVRDVWEENCRHANLRYVCHKAKPSCPWHVQGGVDSSATSCSILHWGGTGRWKGPKISQVAVDSHSNWMNRRWEGQSSWQLLGWRCHCGGPPAQDTQATLIQSYTHIDTIWECEGLRVTQVPSLSLQYFNKVHSHNKPQVI